MNCRIATESATGAQPHPGSIHRPPRPSRADLKVIPPRKLADPFRENSKNISSVRHRSEAVSITAQASASTEH